MAISLLDYTSLIKDELSLGLYKNLLRMNDVLKLFPVVEVGSFVVRGERWSELPSGMFRKLNANFNESTGTTEPVEDRLAIFGGKFSEDDAYAQVKEKVFRDPVQVQFEMWTKTIERQITENIINGSVADDPDGFNGLYQRFAAVDFPASQWISYGAGTPKHVLENAASAVLFFEALDEALYAADLFGSALDGVPRGALLMNKKSWLGIQKAARLCGWSVNTVDLYGYTWRDYRGIPLVDVGLDRDRTTEIIGNTYDPGDADLTSSRIYAVRFTAPDGDVESPGSDGLTIVQAGGLRKLGPIETLTATEWGLEWILGMAHVGDDYCAALLDDFNMAAA